MHAKKDRTSINKPTVVSLFAGGGGSSLGYQAAGYDERLAVEFDSHAIECLRNNFDFPIWDKDIHDLSVPECLKLADVQPGELDILDGSPPCQGFSISGQRNFDDERNQLFTQYTRLLKGLQPKVMVMENVSGMVKGKMKLIFVKILQELKDCGYNVKAKLMNAQYYDVPQSRQRVIFLGVRKDLAIQPTFPTPNRNKLSADQAILGADQDLIPSCGNVIDGLMPICPPGMQLAKARNTKSHFSFARCPIGKPTFTITKSQPQYHPHEDRWMSIGEHKRLQTFPDTYKLHGRWRQQISRLGNSVPPNLIQALASHIADNILKSGKQP